MEIKVTKRGNVVVDGVKYIAKRATPTQGYCKGCAFYELESCAAFPCSGARRPPNFKLPDQEVIFVKKET